MDNTPTGIPKLSGVFVDHAAVKKYLETAANAQGSTCNVPVLDCVIVKENVSDVCDART